MIQEGGIDRFDKRAGCSQGGEFLRLGHRQAYRCSQCGCQWLCKQTIDKLELKLFEASRLVGAGHPYALGTDRSYQIYATSEHASYFTMRDNSAAAGLYSGRPIGSQVENALYTITDQLFASRTFRASSLVMTDHLFNIDNKLMLFDLTNFYFEEASAAARRASLVAQGKSVPTASSLSWRCASTRGIHSFSSILEGNTADRSLCPI